MGAYPFKAIAAVSLNGVIGSGLEIPWRIKEDFAHFKRTTLGGVIVMGRKTWQSLGEKPLPGRENVVISRSMKSAGGARVLSSIEELIKHYGADERNVWICGGAEIYRAALPYCSQIVLSVVKRHVEGDVFFPDISKDFVFSKKLEQFELFDVDIYARRM